MPTPLSDIAALLASPASVSASTSNERRAVRRPAAGVIPAQRTAPEPAEVCCHCGDPVMKVPAIVAELDVSDSTWEKWRRRGAGPSMSRLPNGDLFCRRSDFERWLDTLAEPAAA
jgi:Helix-turn-helix domain